MTLHSDRTSIQDALALVVQNETGEADEESQFVADAILESPVIRRIQAEAIRDAAVKAQEAFVAEQAGIGYARVRTDWLHAEANRIEKGEDA